MTAQQESCLTQLATRTQELGKRIREAFPHAPPDDLRDVEDLFLVLGDEGSEDAAADREASEAAGRRQLARLPVNEVARQVRELQRVYDWPTLRRLILVCPRVAKDLSRSPEHDPISLMDLFNLIDLHLQSGSGFHAQDLKGSPCFIGHESLLPARRALQLLITVQFTLAYRQLLTQPERIAPYQRFASSAAELMRQEGEMLAHRGWPFKDRGYSLFGYSIVSMNWDPLLLWLIFNAHSVANKEWDGSFVGHDRQRPQKLFNDLGYLTAVRKVEGHELGIWYAMNESAVQRLNDQSHSGDRYIRFGKYYLPHGSFNFRECQNCGKLNVHLGDEWKVDSPSLLPPLPLLGGAWCKVEPRSKSERDARDRGRPDALECVYCGSMMGLERVHLTMQTSLKSNPPPYLEEMQRDIRVVLENARHIVFMGYSLPPDDVIYRSMLAARLGRKDSRGDDNTLLVSLVVGKEPDAADEWIGDDALDRCLPDLSGDTQNLIRALRGIAGHGRNRTLEIRVYRRGVPAVFGDGDEARIRDLLFPHDLWQNRRTTPR